MRHRKTRNKLSRDTAHRRSLMLNLSREVLEHERIRTSQAKAKAVKPEVERLITLAKRGDRVDPARETVGRGRGELEARHLGPRVDAGVRPPRDRELDGRLEDPLERRSQLSLDCAQAGLGRPAAEAAPVIREREPDDQGAAVPGA